MEQEPKAKTRVWLVVGGSGAIGTVHWGAQWRKYVFSAGPGTYYDNNCLAELAEFLYDKTLDHRHTRLAVASVKRAKPQ